MTKFLVVLLMLSCFACQNEMADIKAATEDYHYPVQTSVNVQYIYTERGNKTTRLEAPVLERYQQDQQRMVAPEGFKMIFFKEDGKSEEAWMMAKKGEYLTKENVFTAQGDVEIRNLEGEYLLTQKLIYYQDSDRFVTDDWVTIATKNGMLYGKGLESNSSFTSYHILQPTGKFNLNNN